MKERKKEIEGEWKKVSVPTAYANNDFETFPNPCK
jgi:hypothetical protein